MNKETLKKLGLTESEINVYLALIELGSSLASKVAKKCGLHRTNVYDSLDKLIKRGLISFVVRENRKYFSAADPEKLLKILEGKKQEIEREESSLKTIISELRKKKRLTEEKIEAQIYKGKEGFKTVMEMILEEAKGKEWLYLGGTGKVYELLPYYLPALIKKRIKAKIKLKVLLADTKETRNLSKKAFVECKVRFLPKEIKNITAIHVWKDKVAIIPITPTAIEEPVVFLIHNKENADSFRDYFNWLWKTADRKI
ncbi:MAG: hypothetical protein IB618_01185 [Candidatus Pacearchaeota archaeon]|nr:MAG: hypothetical protein IB618_01185 [Candidatus Pacearchaeota archaeon]